MRVIKGIITILSALLIGKLLLFVISLALMSIFIFFAGNLLLAVLGIGTISFPYCIIAALVFRLVRRMGG